MKKEDYQDYDQIYNKEYKRDLKKERKQKQKSDRSFNKLTNLNKKQSKLFNIKKEDLWRVLSISSSTVSLNKDNEFIEASIKGSLKKELTQKKNLLCIGDLVHINEQNLIDHIAPRFSSLSRKDSLHQRKEHTIAANIDQVIITASLKEPSLKPSLLDRYIIAANIGNLTPILVINKVDLATSKEDKQLIKELKNIYNSLSIPIFFVSATEKKGFSPLIKALREKTSVFSGQSGVGKSSILNLILGTNLKTAAVVENTSKGSHTTTRASLIPLEKGGFCIDTPGIKSFAIHNLPLSDIANYFLDLKKYSLHCKFSGCTHTHEQVCGVKQAVEKGKISPFRYASYLSIRENNESHSKYLR